MRTPSLALPAICLLSASAVVGSAQSTSPPAADEPIGINLAYMDTTVSPGEDFFRYVNGSWLDQTEIPADRSRWGSFDELRKRTDAQTLAVLNEAAASGSYPAGSDQGKAAIVFADAIDTLARARAGTAPLQPWLEQIDAIGSIDDVLAYETRNAPYGGGGLLGFGIYSNPTNSNEKALYLGGGQLGLPDRDYYLKTDSVSLDRLAKYSGHVSRMLEYTGMEPAAADDAAAEVVGFERRIATSKLDKVARRDPYKRFNPRGVEQLEAMVPSVDWTGYFGEVGLGEVDTAIVGELAYMDTLEAVLAEADLETIKHYLRWQLIDQTAGYLSPEIERANWEFYGRELRGAEEQQPLDERALAVVNGTLGEAVGQLYVDAYFPPEAKATAEEMVANLREAYAERIGELEWMSPTTKEQALGKLETFRVKIGYPDEWKDYSDLGVDPENSYLENVLAAQKWKYEKDLRERDEPVDKDEWFMSPQTVNAYYNPAYNEIVFPAAILQPPFYDYRADAAVNYGGIGAVIGHEISHGFDDKGSQYDKDGNLKSWWTDEDRTAFDARTGELSAQYSAYEPLPGVRVNGDFTLGENIGDLGGINAAYDGLQLHLAEHGDPGLIEGLTPEQRFFISWGTIWRTKYRDKALENQVLTDPHSPGMYRASGPVVNMQAFYDAFGIDEDDPAYVKPEERVAIW